MKALNRFLYVIIIGALIGVIAYLVMEQKSQDTIAPTISFEKDRIELNIKDDDEALLNGVTATDNIEGDVTSKVFVEGIQKTENEKEFSVTYVVFDNEGNKGKNNRTLVYTDYSSPHFALSGELKFSTDETLNILGKITAIDCIDGDISQFIQIIGISQDLQNMVIGDYNCTLEIQNSIGDTSTLPITIQIYEKTYEDESFKPQILLNQYLVYTEVGMELNPMDYVNYIQDQTVRQIEYGTGIYNSYGQMLNEDGTLWEQTKPGNWVFADSIAYEQEVDYNTPGNYKIHYTYTSDQTGYVGTIDLIVVVE